MIGTLSGCGSKLASTCSMPARSRRSRPCRRCRRSTSQCRRRARLQRVEPVVIGPRGDDLVVIIRPGIEVVVIGGEPGLREARRLRGVQHAERDAGLHAERAHAAHHVEHGVEFRAVAHIAPGGAHAEAVGAGLLARAPRPPAPPRLHHMHAVEMHFLVMRRLRAIAAILRAAAGLDAQQAGLLESAPREIRDGRHLPARSDRAGQIVDRDDLLERPVVPGEAAVMGHAFAFGGQTTTAPRATACGRQNGPCAAFWQSRPPRPREAALMPEAAGIALQLRRALRNARQCASLDGVGARPLFSRIRHASAHCDIPALALFFTIGRPFAGIICLILQVTLIGWIPAALWAVYALSQYRTDEKIRMRSRLALTGIWALFAPERINMLDDAVAAAAQIFRRRFASSVQDAGSRLSRCSSSPGSALKSSSLRRWRCRSPRHILGSRRLCRHRRRRPLRRPRLSRVRRSPSWSRIFLRRSRPSCRSRN